MKKFYVLLRVFVSVEIIGALIFAFGILADVNGKPNIGYKMKNDKRKKEIFRWIFLGGLLLFVTFPVFTQ